MKPKIFQYTIYRLPTDEELKEVNSCNLTADEVLAGFQYTIIGRGINSQENLIMITNSINQLCELYPENNEYKKALEKSKNLKPKGYFVDSKTQIKESLRSAIRQYIHG